MRMDLSGMKIRAQRRRLALTQNELARRAGISASYLNLIEQNKRPVAGALLDRIASGLGIERSLLDGDAERRVVDELNEISADPAVARRSAGRGATEDFVGRHPGWADLLLDVYRAYRRRGQDVLALADRLNRDPFLGEAVHRMLTKVASIRSAAEIVESYGELAPADRTRFLSIVSSDSAELSRTAQSLVDFFENADTRVRAATPTEHVDAFLFAAQNHFPELEEWTESLPATNLPAVPPAASPATARFRAARDRVTRTGSGRIAAILDAAPFAAEEDARALAATALLSYAAAAILMPYDRFFEAAERHRYDIDILAHLFSVSYEQAAHRVTTLRRPGAEGPRFAFMRADASGFITKRLPLSRLPLPRYDHACPLWVVYGAFQSPGMTVRAFGELPAGDRFLFFAKAIDKQPPRAGQPRNLLSLMLACADGDASRVAAADGLDRTTGIVALGSTCRLCPRAGCRHRQEAPLTNEQP